MQAQAEEDAANLEVDLVLQDQLDEHGFEAEEARRHLPLLAPNRRLLSF